MRDDSRCRAQDMRGRSVILFQPDDLRTRKVAFEPQDIFHLRAAPRIDRLVVVADAAQIAPLLRQQPQPQILDAVRVLIFVDHDVTETLLIVLQHLAVRPQDRQDVQQQVAEVAGVHRLQSVLILLVQFPAAPVGEALAFPGIDIGRGHPLVLPPVDQPGQAARRPALLIEVRGDDQLFQQAHLVVGIENGEVRLQPHQFGMPPEHLGPDRMERAEPRHPLHHVADQPADAFAHLLRRLVGEGDRQDFGRIGLAGIEQVRQPRGQCGGLARARTGQHQHRPIGGQHRVALRIVQATEIGGIGRGRGRGGECGHYRTGRERTGRRQARKSFPKRHDFVAAPSLRCNMTILSERC